MNILNAWASFFGAECFRSRNSPLIVLRKSQRGRTPGIIPSLPREIIKSVDEIGFGGPF